MGQATSTDSPSLQLVQISPAPGHGSLFIATLAFAYAALARFLGLAHLGQKVDLIERSIRRKTTPNSPPRSGAGGATRLQRLSRSLHRSPQNIEHAFSH